MTTAPQVLPELADSVSLPERGSGERQRRREARRRLAREQLVVVVVLVLALVVTLIILGQQWLDSGGTGARVGAAVSTRVEVGT